MSTGIKGVYAALITPVDDTGHPDEEGLIRLLDFVLAGGVDGICIGGGTSEYPHFTIDDRKAIIKVASNHLNGRVPFLTAIGAPTMRLVLDLGRFALERGSQMALLPMPYFFRYGQSDLDAYARTVAAGLGGPCLLYNLPGFTNPLDPETTLDLLRTEQNLVGFKDSSGDRSALQVLRSVKVQRPDVSLLCGSDGLFLEALEASWDGGISGIASCAPELLAAIYGHHAAGEHQEARQRQGLLGELIQLIDRLPFPWSIRLACEVRGIDNGPLPFPLSEERRMEVASQRKAYADWFDRNLDSIRADVERLVRRPFETSPTN